MTSADRSPSRYRSVSGATVTSSAPVPWKYCHPVRRTLTSVDASSSTIRTLLLVVLVTVCATTIQIAAMVNQPMRVQLKRGAKENDDASAVRQRKANVG